MVFLPGNKLRAADLNREIPDLAFQDGISTVNNSIALVNATSLVHTVETGSSYVISGVIRYNAATAADLKVGFSVPGSSGGGFSLIGALNTGGVSGDGIFAYTGFANTLSVAGGGAEMVALIEGYLTTLNNGTLQLRFAQQTANVSNCQILDGSYTTIRRV